jgi:hypothetical protein
MDELQLAHAVAVALPDADPRERPSIAGGAELGRAEGAGLRAFRELLLELDSAREFAGLRRALSPMGEYLWVCPEHYVEYDPGLPTLPYGARSSEAN